MNSQAVETCIAPMTLGTLVFNEARVTGHCALQQHKIHILPMPGNQSSTTLAAFQIFFYIYYIYGCVSEKGDHMGWPDSETNYKFVVHPREEIPIIS